MKEFQKRCWDWANKTFKHTVVVDVKERCLRFLEEALELVQVCGLTQAEAHRLVNYVYNRKVGEAKQEIGGVMVTLSVLASSINEDLHDCATTEVERIEEMTETIRTKQQQKPSLRDKDTIVGFDKITAYILSHYPDRPSLVMELFSCAFMFPMEELRRLTFDHANGTITTSNGYILNIHLP